MTKKVFKYQLSTLAAAVSLTMGLSMGTAAEAGYLTDSSGSPVTNNYGECWKAKGGTSKKFEACGDVIAKDSDGDGVTDNKDQCPNTPAGVKVDANGCPLDSDGDGVTDDKDQCPNTPKGDKVDAKGCTIADDGTVSLNMVLDGNFAFDSADLTDAQKVSLDFIINKVMASPGEEEISVIGHTDSTGPEVYNQALSERRAQSAADYMVSKGVNATSIAVSGMGESSPIADNATKAGRAKNRRAEVKTQ